MRGSDCNRTDHEIKCIFENTENAAVCSAQHILKQINLITDAQDFPPIADTVYRCGSKGKHAD